MTAKKVLPPSVHRKLPNGRIAWLAMGAAIWLAALPAAVWAGEPYWTFEVRGLIENEPQSHVIHLLPAPPGIDFPRTCKEFVIHARFERNQGVPPHLLEFFTQDGYDRAIRQLHDALLEHGLVKLGSVDRGFGKVIDGDDECVVLSAGLAVLLDSGRRPAIFSVY